MTALTVRPFDPATDDYDALGALWTAEHPDMPRVGSIWRRRDGEPGSAPAGRVVAWRAEILVGMAEFSACKVAGEPGQLQLGFATAPGPDRGAVLDALYAGLAVPLATHAPPVLVAYARDTTPDMLAFYERHGFEAAQRTVLSHLLAADFLPVIERTRAGEVAAGYEVLSARDWAADDPDWQRQLYVLSGAVVADIPFLGPVRTESWERFLERIADPTQFRSEAAFIVRELATGSPVAISQLLVYDELPGYAFAGLTGVLRTHRQRGLARAVKRATIVYASASGIERIVALNEIDNPMLRLNEEFGFRRQHVQITMERRLATERQAPRGRLG
ncbi:MAG: hypothetical protein O2894_07885 [Planctomycetota bacterium]|nr:hypothetical protein [Planctomycetota bacterium]